MKRLFGIEIMVYILEIVVTDCLQKGTYFLPLYGYFYVLMAVQQLHREKDQFLFCFFSGLLYDLTITSTPFMNTFLFSFIYLLVRKLNIYCLKNKLAFLFCFFLEVILYRTFTYFTLVLIQYQKFSKDHYISSIISSLAMNLPFVLFCSFFLLRKRKEIISHPKKRRFCNFFLKDV